MDRTGQEAVPLSNPEGMDLPAFYPTLIAVASLAEIYAIYPIAVEAGLRPLLVMAVIGIVLTLVCGRLVGRDRGAAVAALGVIGLVGASAIDQALLIAAAVCMILVERAWVARGTMRLRVPWRQLTGALDILLVVLVTLQVGRAVVLRASAPIAVDATGWSIAPSDTYPDIFVVLADGHGRRDVLDGGYGYDMAGTARILVSAGFEEAPRSTSNHSNTRLSLPVLFNGRPLEELNPDADWGGDGQQFVGPGNSSTAQLLVRGGYEVTLIAPGYEHIGIRGDVNYVDVGPRNEVEQAVLSSTTLGRVLDQLTGGFLAATHERALREVVALRTIVRAPADRPQFVYTHLPSPHWPVVFTGNCSFRGGDDYSLGAAARHDAAGDAVSIGLVAEQTRCVDSLIVAAVGDIVAARPDAIVLVLSDHGPEERIDWWHPSEPGISDRMSNLFWARTPGRAGVFPPDVSLVNVFPLLFNAYFGTDLALHGNQGYLGPSNVVAERIPYSQDEQ